MSCLSLWRVVAAVLLALTVAALLLAWCLMLSLDFLWDELAIVLFLVQDMLRAVALVAGTGGVALLSAWWLWRRPTLTRLGGMLAIILVLGIVLGLMVRSIDYAPARFDMQTHAGSLIAHAGGELDGQAYTNSKEALLQSFGFDYSLIELDLQQTADGGLIAAHDWERLGYGQGKPLPTEAQLQASQAERKASYSLLNGPTIRSLFAKHPQVTLVTDKIDNYALLQENFPENHQDLLVEVFSMIDYDKARRMGFRYPMLCLHSYNELRALVYHHRLARLLNRPGVSMVTCSSWLFENNLSLFQELHEAGVNVFVFTSNDLEFISRHLGKNCSAIYTDRVTPAQLEAYRAAKAGSAK